jgi:CheY-like chemotaxis protein
LNGYEVAQALRREPWGSEVCLIALTGWGQESDRQRAIDAGFDRHLTKPVDTVALEALLSKDVLIEARKNGPSAPSVNRM